jgi:hypothetical protein
MSDCPLAREFKNSLPVILALFLSHGLLFDFIEELRLKCGPSQGFFALETVVLSRKKALHSDPFFKKQ